MKAFFHNKKEQKQENELLNNQISIHHTAETFNEVVNKDVVERFSDKNILPKNNLPDTNKTASEHFSKRSDLVITKADKDGTTFILDVKDYIAKAHEMVQNDSFY